MYPKKKKKESDLKEEGAAFMPQPPFLYILWGQRKADDHVGGYMHSSSTFQLAKIHFFWRISPISI